MSYSNLNLIYFKIISGAIYYGDPQNENAIFYLDILGFASPKSAILT
jgi:hypothetical protein